jgi:GGDEF domain-containing protein
MALYIASDTPLPLIQQREISKDAMSSPTWPREAQRFHTAQLRPEQDAVRSHFSLSHVLYAGSYEGCGCGFNFGREYPDAEGDERLVSFSVGVAPYDPTKHTTVRALLDEADQRMYEQKRARALKDFLPES